jgi:methyl-galactoside transport system substrate-binding protein
MKKKILVLLAVLMAFTMFGCSSNQEEEVKEINIGVAIYQFDDNFMTLYRQDIQAYFDDLNAKDSTVHYNVSIVDGANDVNTQTEQVRTFIGQKVDALIVNLVQTSSDALAKEIVESGIPCVFINREIADFEYTDNTCYVGADARDSGTYQGQIIYNLPNHGDVNGNGTVDYIMIMGDPENSDAQYRTEFSIKYLTDNGVTVNCLMQQTGNWNQTQGQELAANALANFGTDIDVIFCNNDGMALGAYQAIVAANRTVGTDIYLVGVDALSEVVQMVKDGTMTGTVLNDDQGQATACCETVIGLLNGTQPENKVNYVPYVMITSENADQYLN